MYSAKYFPGLFCRYPDKKGKNWLKALPADELQAFIHLGLMYADYGRLGGRARAMTAKRDHRGRFISNKENQS